MPNAILLPYAHFEAMELKELDSSPISPLISNISHFNQAEVSI
jgi:hypothetical protein